MRLLLTMPGEVHAHPLSEVLSWIGCMGLPDAFSHDVQWLSHYFQHDILCHAQGHGSVQGFCWMACVVLRVHSTCCRSGSACSSKMAC